jgi:hypothetical protein
MTVSIKPGRNPANDMVCAVFGGSAITVYREAVLPGGGTLNCTDLDQLTDTFAHELGHTVRLNDSGCSGYAMSGRTFHDGSYVPRQVKSSECKKARDVNSTPAESGLPPPPCQCNSAYDCEVQFGIPEFGIWECRRFCQCILTNSPLVLHLPDYSSRGSGQMSWWQQGLCSPEAPAVCLDWRGDGFVSCTEWTVPGSGVAFVVALNDHDRVYLAGDKSIRVQPSRHLFGNVTKGPEGDFPFQHGFAALASYCGQDPAANSRIDLAQCGPTLHVWEDRSGDGIIDLEELQEFQDLGIASLSRMKQTEKRDKCGNTFPAEAEAACTDRPRSRCGYWLDVFFKSR